MEKVYILDKSTHISYFIKGITSIQPQTSSKLTEYPTTEGSPISDHVYRNADSLTISLILDGLKKITNINYIDSSNTKKELSYEEFKELTQFWQNEGIELDIQTVHRLFKNMVLIGESWTEDERKWSTYSPILSFKEARVATIYMSSINTDTKKNDAAYSQEVSTGTHSGIETSSAEGVGKVLGGAATGALIGAGIGSVVPVIGNIAGAVIGGIAGATISFFRWLKGG